MGLLSADKLREYQLAIKHYADNYFTATESATAREEGVLNMLEAEASGDGSSDELDTLISWIRTTPLALKFLKANADFQVIIDGTLTTLDAADGLPSTYVALHAESTANEEELKGLFAVRINDIPGSGVFDDDEQLAAGDGAGNQLTDAYITGLHGAWGATKFNSIFNKGHIKAIVNDGNTDGYDTLAEMVAIYDGWSDAVDVDDFFLAFDKIYNAGYTSLETTELMTVSNSLAKFTAMTSTNAVKLFGTTGGTWTAMDTLYGTIAKFNAMTTDAAAKAIDKCGATFTLLSNVYDADTTKFDTLLTTDALNLCAKGYSGFDYSGLSTGYGATYTTVADIAFRDLVDPKNWPLYKAGVTYANAAAAAGQLTCVALNPTLLNDITSSADPDTVFSDLVANTNFGGVEALGSLCS